MITGVSGGTPTDAAETAAARACRVAESAIRLRRSAGPDSRGSASPDGRQMPVSDHRFEANARSCACHAASVSREMFKQQCAP